MAILDLAAVSKRPGAAGLSLCLQSASAVVPDECAAVLGAEDAEELAEAVTQVYPSEGMDIEEASLLPGKATEDPAAFQTPPRKRRAKSEDVESRKDDAGAITLERLLEMGFDFESAQAALKQEDLTAEKAINFLLKGEVPYASYDGMGGIARTPSPEGVADIEERRSVGLDLEARAGVTELRSDAASTVEDDAKTDELHAFGPINGVPNWDENLRKLLDMGFAREDCVVALQRFKNLDMAADALLNNGNVDQFRSYDASFQALD
mmetsp:Transcript_13254/g.49155  ORF Transcript_13254/g.49155 Transcript_13254/m.49155 type:complete len:265 (+) Transcript_13254:607-1401(+)